MAEAEKGVIVGRIAVKLLPDLTGFRAKAETELAKIERKLKVTIATAIDMTGAKRELLEGIRTVNAENREKASRKVRLYTTISTAGIDKEISRAVREIQARAKERKIEIKTDLVGAMVDLKLDEESLRHVKDQLDDFRKHNSPLKIAVKPDMVNGTIAVAGKRLDVLTRPRRVPILPYLNNGAVAKVATALAALSGARVISSYFRELGESIARLDKLAPIIGTIALAVAGLAGWGLSAASNLFALSASLAQIAPAALALPGILGGIGIGVVVMIAALKDVKKVVPEVVTAMHNVQDAISANFWAKAAQPIRNLVDQLLPQLTAGLRATATALGGYFAGLAAGLSGAFNGVLAGMFTDLSTSIAIATTGTGALTGVIRTLGQVGAGYLPRLAQWFVDITTRFDAFLSKAAADGRLQGWIDAGVSLLGELGRALSGIGSVLAGIARAAQAAGGSTLGMFADTLDRIATTVNGPTFQTALTGVFAAAHKAMNLIATTSGPAVENLFTTLADTMTTLLPLAGQAIGAALGGIAAALAQPAIQKGLIDLITGMKDGITGLLPALAPVGKALGALGTLIGTFLAALGPTLGAAFGALAGVVSTLAPALGPVVTLLGGALTKVITALAPLLGTLAAAVGNLIGGGILPALQSVLTALIPIVSELFAALAPLVGQVLTTLGSVLGTVLTALAPLVSMLLKLVVSIVGPLITAILEVVRDALPKLGEKLGGLVQALMPVMTALQAVVDFLMPILVPIIKFVAQVLVDSVIGIVNGITNIITGVVDVIMGIWNTFAGLFTGDWSRMWDGIKQLFSGVWDLICGIVEVALNIGILGAAKKVWTLLRAGWELLWVGIKDVTLTLWKALTENWATFLADLKAAPGAALNAIKNFFASCWNDLVIIAKQLWFVLKDTFLTGINTARAVMSELPGKILDAVKNLPNLLIDAGKAVIRGLIDGIKSMFGSVKDALGNLTGKLKDWKGPPARDKTLLVGAGQFVIDGFLTGLESRYDAVRDSLRDLTGDIARDMAAMTIDPPQIGGTTAGRMTAQLAGALAATTGGGGTKVLNYYAAPGSSLSSQEELFAAAHRARMVGW